VAFWRVSASTAKTREPMMITTSRLSQHTRWHDVRLTKTGDPRWR
jgi:hypothetical protein